jgi:hypothetical protein
MSRISGALFCVKNEMAGKIPALQMIWKKTGINDPGYRTIPAAEEEEPGSTIPATERSRFKMCRVLLSSVPIRMYQLRINIDLLDFFDGLQE